MFTVATVKCSENGAYLRGDLLLELARGESRHIREHGLQGCYSLGLSSSEIIFVCSCQSEKEVLTYLNEVYNLISRRGILPYIGIGELQNSPAKMDDAYHTAALASDALLIKNLSGVLSASNFAQIEKMMPAFPMKQLHSLSFATLRKDTNGIKEELSRLMQLIKHVDTPVYMVRLLFCNIVHILETALLQYEPDAKLSVVSQANTYGTPLGYQEMENEISALAQRLINHIESAVATGIEDTPKLRIEEVDAFIISHLSSPDFSITVLADAFGLSVSNMSHFFKTQKGVGYKQYIDYMRIEYAQKLLKESDMTVNKVAEASGYPDKYGGKRRGIPETGI